MGRPYDHQYFFAGSGCLCGTCSKPIDSKTQDWRAFKRTKNYDWGYVTHHRECSADDSPWVALEKQAATRAARCAELAAEADALVAKYAGFDVLSAVEDAGLRAETQASAHPALTINERN